jgi:hypothetical protein
MSDVGLIAPAGGIETEPPATTGREAVRSARKHASVIVVNFNGRSHIADCLQSLLADGRPNTDIVVVDNCSTDGSAELVASRFPEVRLIRNDGNHGFGHGCNLAAQQARGEYLVFLNPDTEVRPGWIDALADALETYPGAGKSRDRRSRPVTTAVVP